MVEGTVMAEKELDFTIERLGECHFPSPMQGVRYTRDDDRFLFHSNAAEVRKLVGAGRTVPAMELAGPRERIFFDPTAIACGIVTCGGLCPGIRRAGEALRAHPSRADARSGESYRQTGYVGDRSSAAKPSGGNP
jgi:hypothetical protein